MTALERLQNNRNALGMLFMLPAAVLLLLFLTYPLGLGTWLGFTDAKIAQPIDTTKLSNWKDVFPALQKAPGVLVDGNIVMTPCDWGNSSIAYRTDLVDADFNKQPSWTIFTDDNGTDYLVFSNAKGRGTTFVSKLRDSDSLYAEPAVAIGHFSAGREGNAMFKLDGKYYSASSDLHGWNASVAHVIESTAGITGRSAL